MGNKDKKMEKGAQKRFLIPEKKSKRRVGSFKEIDGNLITLALEDHFDFIGHGNNCFATMGAGIALPIGLTFPKAKKADADFAVPGWMKLGNFSMAVDKTPSGQVLRIVNFYSQYRPGRDFDKEALILGLKKFSIYHRDNLSDSGKYRFGLPIIGCGIAGGDWNEVRELVKAGLSEFDVTIVHFKE